jgi:hypothetical protein
VPVLARSLEAAGLSTVMVTNSPFWAERIGLPRALAVEFPFGNALGAPGDAAQQRRVIEQALGMLEEAQEPGTILHSRETWPEPQKEAIKRWQPADPPPVMDFLRPQVLEMMRRRRRA